MRNQSGLLIIVGVVACLAAACTVSEYDPSEDTYVVLADEYDEADSTAVSASPEMSPTAADSTEAKAIEQSVSCFYVWDCEICINGTTRNVKYRVCDDGSEEATYVGPCGQACF